MMNNMQMKAVQTAGKEAGVTVTVVKAGINRVNALIDGRVYTNDVAAISAVATKLIKRGK